MSRDKTNEILTVYLRKTDIYIHYKRINKNDKTAVLMIRGSELTVRLNQYSLFLKGKECFASIKGISGKYY